MDRVHVDATAAEAPYEQVRRQVTDLVTSGDLAPGERLPTVRALATDLGIAANTVARAYQELEATGVVRTDGRRGTFVQGSGAERAAREAARAYADTVRDLGLDDAAAVELVRRAIDRPRSS